MSSIAQPGRDDPSNLKRTTGCAKQSIARTGLAKSHRGGFNNTGGAAMVGHAIQHSIKRAGIEPGEVDEVVLGCGASQDTTGNNIGRVAALKAGCPVRTTGATVSRYCSSGLNAIETAAGRIIVDGEQVVVGAGIESFNGSFRDECLNVNWFLPT